MNIFECAVIKNMVGGGGGGASEELLARIADLEARVEALEPSKQLFNIDAIPQGMMGTLSDGTPCVKSSWDGVPLRDVCPNLEIGKTYTFSAKGIGNPGYIGNEEYSYIDAPKIYTDNNELDLWVDESGSYFWLTLTEAIYNTKLFFAEANVEIYYNPDEPPMCTTIEAFYYNIMVNEGTEPLPYEPYKA